MEYHPPYRDFRRVGRTRPTWQLPPGEFAGVTMTEGRCVLRSPVSQIDSAGGVGSAVQQPRRQRADFVARQDHVTHEPARDAADEVARDGRPSKGSKRAPAFRNSSGASSAGNCTSHRAATVGPPNDLPPNGALSAFRGYCVRGRATTTSACLRSNSDARTASPMPRCPRARQATQREEYVGVSGGPHHARVSASYDTVIGRTSN